MKDWKVVVRNRSVILLRLLWLPLRKQSMYKTLHVGERTLSVQLQSLVKFNHNDIQWEQREEEEKEGDIYNFRYLQT